MSEWIPVSESYPEDETPVLILHRGEPRFGEIRWEYPTFEETFEAFKHWDDPYDDGKDWDWVDVTHWMELPEAPKEKKDETI